ncbi:MAG: hypothetical protein R3E96_16705 [Planctomycetota bacterium]
MLAAARGGVSNRTATFRRSRPCTKACDFALAAHFPSELTPHNFTMRYANDRSREVLAATQDREENPFLAYFETQILPRLLERRPRVVGLSVIYGSQLIPALTLGRLIRQHLPECHDRRRRLPGRTSASS